MPGLIEDANPELEDELYRQRHTLAHLLASAVQTMFPEVKLGFGPPVDNGFYYDFLTEEPFSETQLKKIQKKMMKLAGRNMPMEYSSLSIEEALKLFLENEDLRQRMGAAGRAYVEREYSWGAVSKRLLTALEA